MPLLITYKVPRVVEYRTFRNDDPPHLAEVWNQSFTGRGAVRLRSSSPLEGYVLAKPYFDRAGLIVAEDAGQRVGFVHAGFGPNETETALSRSAGVTCALGVLPSHRRRGIGTELLRRSEAYLAAAGAAEFYAGPLRPHNPFYFGLYGGSELPGFLASDADSGPFLARRGYAVHDSCLVLQLQLVRPVNIVDGRFPEIRKRYEVCAGAREGPGSWWQECVLGPIELIEFRLQEKVTGKVAARASVWDMEGFSWRWGQPAVGITDVVVAENLRRQGMAKFLLAQLIRYLQEQFFSLVEVQTLRTNEQAVQLYKSLGFEQVDAGSIYKKQASV